MKVVTGRLLLVAGAVALAFGCSSDDITNNQAARADGGPQFTVTAPGDAWTDSDNQKAFVCVVSPVAGTYTIDVGGSAFSGSGNPGPTLFNDPANVAPGTCVHVATTGAGAGFPDPDNVTADEIAHPSNVALAGVTVEQAVFNSQGGGFISSATSSASDPATGIISNEQAVRIVFTYAQVPDETPCPAGSFGYSFNGAGDLLIKYDQFPAPNDNSYGVNAVGWGTKGHKFSDLTGSDKAGFQLVDGSGVVQLSFTVDYLSADANAPSGYNSLGVTGGEGKMLVGTAAGITATTSLANNLNNINIPGLFLNKVQQFGTVNVLLDSPPTDAAHQTYAISDPALAGWDFHNTYYVTISAAKLASLGFDAATWKVEPNPTQLHNSPAKPCPTAPGGECNLSTTKYEVKGKEVKIAILNGGTVDQFLTQLSLDWPAVNGKLTQVKLGKDVVYDTPDIAAGPAVLTTSELVADAKKRKLGKGTNEVLTLVFEKNADTNLANYLASVEFGSCILALLPN